MSLEKRIDALEDRVGLNKVEHWVVCVHKEPESKQRERMAALEKYNEKHGLRLTEDDVNWLVID